MRGKCLTLTIYVCVCMTVITCVLLGWPVNMPVCMGCCCFVFAGCKLISPFSLAQLPWPHWFPPWSDQPCCLWTKREDKRTEKRKIKNEAGWRFQKTDLHMCGCEDIAPFSLAHAVSTHTFSNTCIHTEQAMCFPIYSSPHYLKSRSGRWLWRHFIRTGCYLFHASTLLPLSLQYTHFCLTVHMREKNRSTNI